MTRTWRVCYRLAPMADRSLELTFLGGTGTITGARYLLASREASVLVDCGLYQGFKNLRMRNRGVLPAPCLDAVVLTHAHLDHAGHLPHIVADGYRGPIYCTPGTAALCALLLPDSASLQLQDAAFANKKGYGRHHPATPLYSADDVVQTLRQLRPIAFGEPFALPGGLTGNFTRAGHTIGAASLCVDDGARRVLFSGDLGREQDIMMAPPESRPPADVIVLESTYGGRQHDGDDPGDVLAELIRRTVARGGVVLIPAYAFGRAQALLVLLHKLRRARKLPDVPVYVDSPMASAATELYAAHPGEHRLSRDTFEAAFDGVQYIREVDASHALDTRSEPAIIIAAAAMATGGPILHHLKRFAPDPNSAIVLTGYQAAGTRGGALAAGADTLKIHGRHVQVRAEVLHLDMLSAHADQDELLDWLEHGDPPRHTFLVHGESSSADALRHTIAEQLRWPVSVPDYRETVDIHAL